jgi:hypothetical protein
VCGVIGIYEILESTFFLIPSSWRDMENTHTFLLGGTNDFIVQHYYTFIYPGYGPFWSFPCGGIAEKAGLREEEGWSVDLVWGVSMMFVLLYLFVEIAR